MDGEDGHLLREVDKPNVEQKVSKASSTALGRVCALWQFSVNGDDGGQPEDHRIAAVVAALCFFPTGLASLYHSSKVSSLKARVFPNIDHTQLAS